MLIFAETFFPFKNKVFIAGIFFVQCNIKIDQCYMFTLLAFYLYNKIEKCYLTISKSLFLFSRPQYL